MPAWCDACSGFGLSKRADISQSYEQAQGSKKLRASETRPVHHPCFAQQERKKQVPTVSALRAVILVREAKSSLEIDYGVL